MYALHKSTEIPPTLPSKGSKRKKNITQSAARDANEANPSQNSLSAVILTYIHTYIYISTIHSQN